MKDRIVSLGRVSGVHGVKGWVKIHSLTEPREAIFEYQPWLLGESREAIRVIQGKRHGNRLIALLENADDRDAAEGLVNQEIFVHRDQFPETESGEFYWTDLEGLEVRMGDGTVLGVIERMMATGANDVMVVRGDKERLIPFVHGQYVTRVDLENGFVVVDWDPDF